MLSANEAFSTLHTIIAKIYNAHPTQNCPAIAFGRLSSASIQVHMIRDAT